MRLTYPRLAAVALVAGGALLTAVSGPGLAATATRVATLPSQQSCEPIQLPAPSSSPSTPPPATTPAATPASLCIAVTAAQASSELGQPARWTVSVWATGAAVA